MWGSVRILAQLTGYTLCHQGTAEHRDLSEIPACIWTGRVFEGWCPPCTKPTVMQFPRPDTGTARRPRWEPWRRKPVGQLRQGSWGQCLGCLPFQRCDSGSSSKREELKAPWQCQGLEEMGATAAKSLLAKDRGWGELEGSSDSCQVSGHRDWMWSLAQSLWPLSLSPPISWGRKEGRRMVMAKLGGREQPSCSLSCASTAASALLAGQAGLCYVWLPTGISVSCPSRGLVCTTQAQQGSGECCSISRGAQQTQFL